MKRKDFNTEMAGLTSVFKLLKEYKNTKNEKKLDLAMEVIAKLHEKVGYSFRKQRRRDNTDEINKLIEETNKKKENNTSQ